MQYHYRQIRELADEHLSALPSSIKGWILMFMVMMDAAENALGQGAISMWLLSTLPSSASAIFSPGLSVVAIQLILFIWAASILMQSAWHMHLPYALRESNIWFYTIARHIKGQSFAISSERSNAILTVEIVVLLGLTQLLQPLLGIFADLNDISGISLKTGYLFFGLLLLIATWVVSSLLRKFKNDSSIVYAIIIAGSILLACRIYGPDVQTLFRAWHDEKALQEFFYWETGLLFTGLLLIAATALGDIHQNDSPIVNLAPNDTTFTNLSESLQGFKAHSFKVSLVPGANQRVLVFSRDWHNDEPIVHVHRHRTNLPVVTREFWFWDLTLFKELLSQPLDFEKDTLDGMYRLRADIEAIPKTAMLNNPPTYLSQVAVDLAQDTLLDIGSLRRTIGETLLRQVETILQNRFNRSQALGRALNAGNILVEIESLRADLKQNLAKLKPTHRGSLESFSQIERRQYFDELTHLINSILIKSDAIMSTFEPSEITQTLVRMMDDSQLIRSLAGYPQRRCELVWSNKQPVDKNLYDLSADYIIDVLGITIADVKVVLSPRMEELRSNAQALVQSISDEIQSWQAEISDMEAAALDRIAIYPTLGRYLNLRTNQRSGNLNSEASTSVDFKRESDQQKLKEAQPEIAESSSFQRWQD